MNYIWSKVKRNPVLNAFAIAVVTQFLQDLQAGNIDFAHICGYLAALALGVWAREFTTPAKEANQKEEALRASNRELMKQANQIDN